MKKIHCLFLSAALAGALFSCKKPAEPTPAPEQLSTTEASTQLSTSGTTYKTDSTAFKMATTTVSSSLSSLSNLNSAGVPSNLGVSFSSIRLSNEELDKNGEVFDAISSQMAALVFKVTNPLSANGRIPNTFDAAKGIWELQTTTSSSTAGGSYSYCYINGVNYYKYFAKTGASDKIIIKYPAYYSYLSCASVVSNNAVYTISNLETKIVSRNTCKNGVSTTVSDTVATKLDATLSVDGKEFMVYNYTSSGVFNAGSYTPSSYTITMKVGSYEYSASSTVQSNFSSGSEEVSWKNNGTTIMQRKAYVEGDGTYSPSTNACSSGLTFIDIFSTLTKYGVEIVRSNIKFTGEVNYKSYIADIKAKYGSADVLGYDSTVFKNILKDTTITDKYFSFALYKTDNGAKIGDLKLRLNPVTVSYFGYFTSYLNGPVWYIHYKDGTKELASKKLYNSSYFTVQYPFYRKN